MPEQDSTSGPALKFQGVLVEAVMQKVTSVVLPGKGRKNNNNKVDRSNVRHEKQSNLN